MLYLSALEVCSRRGAVQIHAIFTFTDVCVYKKCAYCENNSNGYSKLQSDMLKQLARKHSTAKL